MFIAVSIVLTVAGFISFCLWWAIGNYGGHHGSNDLSKDALSFLISRLLSLGFLAVAVVGAIGLVVALHS